MSWAFNPLTASQRQQLEELCLEFEADLQAGLTRIGDLAARVELELRNDVLHELLVIHFGRQRDRGETLKDLAARQRLGCPPELVAQAIKEVEAHARQPGPPRDDALPEELGRFILKEKLGAGAFGLVGRYHDPLMNRSVAIKVAKDATDTCDLLRDETRHLIKAEHPGVVTVYEAGMLRITGQCRAYRSAVVMRYLSGGSLQKKLKGDPFPVKNVGKLLTPVCKAVSYIHRHNGIHRDLKPGNILMDDEGQTYVSDFGLAVDRVSLCGASTTPAGTWAYISPDVFRALREGRTREPQPSDDLWSLSVIAFQLLTGRQPFDGANENELITNILNGNRPALLSLTPHLPPELAEFVDRGLHSEPSRRFQSADELLAALIQALGSEPAVRLGVRRAADSSDGSSSSGSGSVPQLSITHVFDEHNLGSRAKQPPVGRKPKLEPVSKLGHLFFWILLALCMLAAMCCIAIWFWNPARPVSVANDEVTVPIEGWRVVSVAVAVDAIARASPNRPIWLDAIEDSILKSEGPLDATDYAQIVKRRTETNYANGPSHLCLVSNTFSGVTNDVIHIRSPPNLECVLWSALVKEGTVQIDLLTRTGDWRNQDQQSERKPWQLPRTGTYRLLVFCFPLTDNAAEQAGFQTIIEKPDELLLQLKTSFDAILVTHAPRSLQE